MLKEEYPRSLYPNRESSKLNIVLNVLIMLIATLLIIEVIFNLAYQGVYVVGCSMEDTLIGADNDDLLGGNYLYIDKHAKPTYGNIVVVRKYEEVVVAGKKQVKTTIIIKRVIALGGDTVKLDNGVLMIKYSPDSVRYTGIDDFITVSEPYLNPDNNDGDCDHRPQHNEPLTFPQLNNRQLDENGYLVEKDCMFLMGDNRNCSLDSRADNGRSFPVADLEGVAAGWALRHLDFLTNMHQFFYFDLPNFFKIKK